MIVMIATIVRDMAIRVDDETGVTMDHGVV
jgi:hypothetical protein